MHKKVITHVVKTHDNWHYSDNKFGTNKIYVNKRTDNETKFRDENLKRVLCNNMLMYGKCNYGDKCLYAHSLDDQNKDPIRERAYNIIDPHQELPEIADDILTDKELCRNLIQLTKVCSLCESKKCPGGYNCKYGAFDKDHQVCYDDLCNESCTTEGCTMIHLSKKGLLLFNDKKKKFSKYKTSLNDPIIGTLLSDEYFFKINKSNDYDSDLDSNESIEKIKQYLNDDTNESYEESIFIFKT
jgi:hypothetical protein